MEKLANLLAGQIRQKLGLDCEKTAVVSYGLLAILQTVFLGILIVLISWPFQITLASIVLFLGIGLLRKYAGGVHASSLFTCNCVSLIICLGAGCLISYPMMRYFSQITALLFWIVCSAAGLFQILRKAPMQSPKKPIRVQRRQILRKKAILASGTYLLLSLVFLLFCYQSPFCQKLGFSLSFCLLWQAVTMSNAGSFLLNKFDALLSKIIR